MQIYLAGGCFWGVQAYFDLVAGVKHTRVGYANAKPQYITNLSYEVVCSGLSGAVEAVEIDFDESILPIDSLLARFFSIIDPVSVNKQGNDIGSQYRSGIYAQKHTQESPRNNLQAQNDTAKNSKDAQSILAFAEEFIAHNVAPNFSLPIATEVLPMQNFTPAESYHQKYLAKNPNGYCHIDISRALEPIKYLR